MSFAIDMSPDVRSTRASSSKCVSHLEIGKTPSPSSSDTSSIPSSIALTPMSIQSQSPLLRTPSEIIHRVLSDSGADDPVAIAQAAKTCKELRFFIYENPDQALWRDIHLRLYDDPRNAGSFPEVRKDFDWKKRVQNREFVTRLCRDWGEDRYDNLPELIDMVASTLLDMYLDMPASSDPPQPHSKSNPLASTETRNAARLKELLSSETFKYIYTHLSSKQIRPLLRPLRPQPGNPNRRAKREPINPTLMRLHALLPPYFDIDDEDSRQQRGHLRERVYSNQNYHEKNDWGPFYEDGSVDWTLVDAISSVMMGNAKDLLTSAEESWTHAVSPMSYGIEPTRGWGFNDLRRPEGLKLGDVWDWAGVEGQWCGSYAFLDYSDWIALNEPRLIQLRRAINELDLSTYREAVGDLMRLDLTIERPPKEGSSSRRITEGLPPVETDLPTSNLLPPIRFHGSSVQSQGGFNTFPSSNAAASFVRGVVQLTADDPPQVRWTLVIRYGGEDRWRLECVQVGGRGSERGFFGIWTAADKEDHSPNGPVWYWKP